MGEKIAKKIVGGMCNQQIIDSKNQEKYVYVYTILIEKFIVLGTICVTSIFLNNLINTIIFLLFFMSLRRRTGGYHAETFFQCYIGSNSICIIMTLCEHIWINNIRWIWLMLLISVIYIFATGTVNHPNMNMKKDEVKESKRRARLILLIELLIIIILKKVSYDYLAIGYMAMAIITCSLLLFISKLIGQEVRVDGKT